MYVKRNSGKKSVKNITGDNMKNKKKNQKNPQIEIAANSVVSQPQTAYELINKYGTYEIQPTADSDNDFPKIAQGLPRQENRKVVDKDWDGYKNKE